MTSSCVIGVEESWQVWLSTRKAIQVTVYSENFHYVTRSATDISAGKITLPCISGSIRNRIKETVRRKLLRNNCHSEVIGSIPQCSDTWSNADRWPLLKYHMLCNNCCWVKKNENMDICSMALYCVRRHCFRGVPFLKRTRGKTHHISPPRANYWVSFVSFISNETLTFAVIVLCAISSHNGPQYIDCVYHSNR